MKKCSHNVEMIIIYVYSEDQRHMVNIHSKKGPLLNTSHEYMFFGQFTVD